MTPLQFDYVHATYTEPSTPDRQLILARLERPRTAPTPIEVQTLS